MLFGFGNKRPWGGVHLGFEIPRDDAISLYGKATHYFFQRSTDTIAETATAIDLTTIPFTQNVNAIPKMNYTVIEGGTRYYLGNGFDYGWAGYGGTKIMLVINKVNVDYDGFDESLYQLTTSEDLRMDGSIFSIGAGLGGGVKYSSARFGTFYFDANVGYMLLGQSSSANVYGGQYASLLFDMNLGWRKDFGW